MRGEYKMGLKAGLSSGLAWGALMAVASFIEVQVNYSTAFSYYAGLYTNDSSVFNGMTPSQYINYNLEFNTALFLIVGIGFGALVGLIFTYIGPKFLPKQSYMVKGIIVSVFLWLLYNLSLVTLIDPFELVSSVAISLFGGYLLGYLFTRFSILPLDSRALSKKNSER